MMICILWFKDNFYIGDAKPLEGDKEKDAKCLIAQFYETDHEGVCMFGFNSVIVNLQKSQNMICIANEWSFLVYIPQGYQGTVHSDSAVRV